MDEAGVLEELLRGCTRGTEVGAAAAPPAPQCSPAAIAIVAGVAILAAAWVWLAARGVDGAIMLGWVAGLSDPIVDLLANLAVFGGLIVIALSALRLAPVDTPLATLGTGAALALGSALGLGGLLAAAAQAWLGGHVLLAPTPVAAGAGMLVLGAAVTLFQATAEELFFRGWLQPRLARITGTAGAIGLAALAFALVHIFGGARDLLSLFNIFLAGLLFGLLRHHGGTIAAPVAAHFAWNWAETMLLGLSPNPGGPAYGAIVDLDLAGAGLWGGSGEGLNASVPVTLTLAALILPLLAWRRPAGA